MRIYKCGNVPKYPFHQPTIRFHDSKHEFGSGMCWGKRLSSSPRLAFGRRFGWWTVRRFKIIASLQYRQNARVIRGSNLVDLGSQPMIIFLQKEMVVVVHMALRRTAQIKRDIAQKYDPQTEATFTEAEGRRICVRLAGFGDATSP